MMPHQYIGKIEHPGGNSRIIHDVSHQNKEGSSQQRKGIGRHGDTLNNGYGIKSLNKHKNKRAETQIRIYRQSGTEQNHE
jgi:hypothetical protein